MTVFDVLKICDGKNKDFIIEMYNSYSREDREYFKIDYSCGKVKFRYGTEYCKIKDVDLFKWRVLDWKYTQTDNIRILRIWF